MQDIQHDQFDELVTKSAGVSLVKFYLTTCGPCKILDATLEQLDDQYNIYTVNLAENQDLAREYKVKTVPTTVVFQNGESKGFFLGMRTKEFIIDKVTELTEGNN
jgi:thioredoxin 1